MTGDPFACRCDARGLSPCTARATQEDALCDMCRKPGPCIAVIFGGVLMGHAKVSGGVLHVGPRRLGTLGEVAGHGG